jgi:plasmid stabilization system protein ParE
VRVRFTSSARTQFLEGLLYIALDKPGAARRLRSRAATALQRLATFPSSGRHIPEFPTLPHREVALNPLRFFYRVEKKTVWIVAVWHEKQSPGSPDAA